MPRSLFCHLPTTAVWAVAGARLPCPESARHSSSLPTCLVPLTRVRPNGCLIGRICNVEAFFSHHWHIRPLLHVSGRVWAGFHPMAPLHPPLVTHEWANPLSGCVWAIVCPQTLSLRLARAHIGHSQPFPPRAALGPLEKFVFFCADQIALW